LFPSAIKSLRSLRSLRLIPFFRRFIPITLRSLLFIIRVHPCPSVVKSLCSLRSLRLNLFFPFGILQFGSLLGFGDWSLGFNAPSPWQPLVLLASFFGFALLQAAVLTVQRLNDSTSLSRLTPAVAAVSSCLISVSIRVHPWLIRPFRARLDLKTGLCQTVMFY
jgi:hypothetical protein